MGFYAFSVQTGCYSQSWRHLRKSFGASEPTRQDIKLLCESLVAVYLVEFMESCENRTHGVYLTE